MPGRPGSGGPIPKRSDQKLGHRTKAELASIDKLEVSGPVDPGQLLVDDPHPIVQELWDAALESGQSQFYERSDWATLNLVLHELNCYLGSERKNAQILASIMGALTELMFTEGSRRRLKFEIHRDKGKQDAPVIDMAAMKQMMLGK